MKFKYTILGLDCPNCAGKLAGIISKKEGINSAKINFLTEKITVESELCEEAVLKILTESAKAFSKSIVIKK